MSVGLIAVLVGAVAVVAGIALFFILRNMKGTIVIQSDRTSFDPGETITGKIDVEIKKETRGNNLTISLIADRKTTYYDGDEKRTDHDEVYRDELLIEDRRVYPVGYNNTYSFELKIPAMDSENNQGDNLLNTLGAVMNTFGTHRRTSKVEWYLEARLDAEGLDLVKKQNVQLRMFAQ